MNFLLVCPKDESNEYIKVLNSIPNSNLLGTINIINNNFVNEIRDKYQPHIIIYVHGVAYKGNCNFKSTISHIRENYSYIRVVYFHIYDELPADDYEFLNELGIFDVITRPITNIELGDIFETPLSNRDNAEFFNNRKTDNIISKPVDRKKFKFFYLIPAIIFAVIILVIISAKLLLSDSDLNSVTASRDESVSSIDSIPYEEITTISEQTQTISNLNNLLTSPKDDEKQTTICSTTTAVTENHNKTKTTVAISSNNDKSSNSSSNYVVEPTEQQNNNNQDVSSSASSYIKPNNNSSIVDNKITLSVSQDTIKLGSTYTIKVFGYAAAQGCDWTTDEGTVIKFISATTSKVVIKAVGEGTAKITATAKSNGATAVCYITVSE